MNYSIAPSTVNDGLGTGWTLFVMRTPAVMNETRRSHLPGNIETGSLMLLMMTCRTRTLCDYNLQLTSTP